MQLETSQKSTARDRITRYVGALKSQLRGNRFAIFAALVSMSLVAVATGTYGLGMNPDSVTYVSAGVSLASGDGLKTISGAEFTLFPPLLPALIAVFELIGLDGRSGIGILNVASLGFSVFLATQWLLDNVESKSLRLVGTAAIGFAPSLITSHGMLWSEPIFGLMTILVLLLASKSTTPVSAKTTVLLASVVAVALMTRYAGAPLFGVAIIFLLGRPKPTVQQLKLIAVFSLISLTPIVVWIGHNIAADGTMFGDRSPSNVGLLENINAVVSTFSLWLVPKVSLSVRAAVFAVLLISLAIGLLRVKRSGDVAASELRFVAPFVVFVVTYTAYLIVARTLVAMDPISDRLLLPVYIPLVLSAVWSADKVRQSMGEIPRRAAFAIAAIVIGFSGVFVVRGIDTTNDLARSGQGFTSIEFSAALDSPVIPRDPQVPVYSNAPFLTYLATQQKVMLSPRLHKYNSPTSPVEDLPILEAEVAGDRNALLLWSNDRFKDNLVGLDDLKSLFSVELMDSDQSWELYLLDAK